jgi:WD40 repeat protein
MKRCPTCNRTFSDESISFCLVDGSVLSAPFENLTDDKESDLYPTIPSVGVPTNLAQPSEPISLKVKDRRPWVIGILLFVLSIFAITVFILIRVRNERLAASESKLLDGTQSSESWKLKATLSGHGGSVVSIAFSRANQTLAAATNGETVKIWDLRTEEVNRELTSSAQIHSVEFSPTGDVLMGVGFRDTGQESHGLHTMTEVGVRIWDTRDFRKPPRMIDAHTFVLSAAFSPDGRIIAIGGCGKDCNKGGEVTTWDAEQLRRTNVFKGHSDTVVTVAFSPDNRLIASGSVDKSIKLWDVQRATLIRTLTGPADIIRSVSFSPDGRLVASASDDNFVRVWDVQSGTLIESLEHDGQSLTCVAFSPDGNTLAVGSGVKETSGQILLWDVRSWTLKLTLSGHKDRVRTIVFAANGQTLASGAEDKTVKLWEREK